MKLFLVILLVDQIFGWKPIPGPTQNSFSLTQSHPSLHHNILSSEPTGIGSSSSSSYISGIGGSSFLDDNAPGHEEGLFSGKLFGSGLSSYGGVSFKNTAIEKKVI